MREESCKKREKERERQRKEDEKNIRRRARRRAPPRDRGETGFLFAGFRPFDNPVVDAPRPTTFPAKRDGATTSQVHMRIPLLERKK